MAHLLRLIVAGLLALVCGLANANVPTVPQYTSPDGYTIANHMFGSPGAVCAALTAALAASAPDRTYSPVVCSINDGIKMIVTLKNNGEYISTDYYGLAAGPAGCPENANFASGGTSCQCATTFVENGDSTACVPKPKVCEPGYIDVAGTCMLVPCDPDESRVNGLCVKDPECPQGQTRVNGKCEPKKCQSGEFAGEYKFTSTSPSGFCQGGCQVSVTSFVTASKDGKVTDIVGMGYLTGATCSGGDGPPTDTGPTDPPDPNNPGGGNNGGGNTGGGGTGGGTGPGNGGDPGNNPPTKCPDNNCTGNNGQPPTGGNDPGQDGTCPEAPIRRRANVGRKTRHKRLLTRTAGARQGR